MKYLYKVRYKSIAVTVAALVMAGLSLNYSAGPGNNGAGSAVNAPFSSGSCSNGGCHSGGSFSPSVTIQLLSGSTPVTTYTASSNYTLRITINASNTTSNTRYGFQAVSVQSASPYTAVNSWGTTPSGMQTYTTGGRTHMEHTTPRTSNVIDIPWTGPSTTNGSITFYIAGNVVNNNGAVTGDNPVFGTLTVTPPCAAPNLSGTPTHVKCKGGSDGAINLSVSGGTSPFSYAWTGPGSFSSSSQNISGLKAGTYKVVVTATGGCKDSITVSVNEPATGVTVSGTSNGPVCEGDTLLLDATATGGTGVITYSWAGPNSFSSNSQNNTLFPATTAMSGSYGVSATDASGCKSPTVSVTATVNPKATVDTFNYTQGTGADSNKITFTSVNIQNQDSIRWIFGDGNTLTGNANPAHTYASSGTYTVMLIVKNACGSDTVTRQVNVDPVGINDVTARSLVSVYPNPANNVLFIEATTAIRFSNISLTDVTGRKVLQVAGGLQKHSIDISALAPGMYYLKLETANGQVLTEKINITR